MRYIKIQRPLWKSCCLWPPAEVSLSQEVRFGSMPLASGDHWPLDQPSKLIKPCCSLCLSSSSVSTLSVDCWLPSAKSPIHLKWLSVPSESLLREKCVSFQYFIQPCLYWFWVKRSCFRGSIPSKAIFRFNEIHIKTTSILFAELEKKN